MEDEILVDVKFVCPMCGKVHVLKHISVDKYLAYVNKEDTVQNIFSDLSPVDREKFITGYCEDCQNEIFNSEED